MKTRRNTHDKYANALIDLRNILEQKKYQRLFKKVLFIREHKVSNNIFNALTNLKMVERRPDGLWYWTGRKLNDEKVGAVIREVNRLAKRYKKKLPKEGTTLTLQQKINLDVASEEQAPSKLKKAMDEHNKYVNGLIDEVQRLKEMVQHKDDQLFAVEGMLNKERRKTAEQKSQIEKKNNEIWQLDNRLKSHSHEASLMIEELQEYESQRKVRSFFWGLIKVYWS